MGTCLAFTHGERRIEQEDTLIGPGNEGAVFRWDEGGIGRFDFFVHLQEQLV